MTEESFKNRVRKNPVLQGVRYAFVDRIIQQVITDHYPEIQSIISFQRIKHKRRVGDSNSAFIYSYIVTGTSLDGSTIRRRIVYSAHTDGSRRRAFEILTMLRDHGFSAGAHQVVRPLEYRNDIHALLYEGIEGKTLYHYMKQRTPGSTMHSALALVAEWIRAFHTTKLTEKNAQLVPVFDPFVIYSPATKITTDVRSVDAHQGEKLAAFFSCFKDELKKSGGHTARGVTHGDLHPENVILKRLDQAELTMVDMTDVALGDKMRDLGTFIQQFKFMGKPFYKKTELERLAATYLAEYFGHEAAELETEIIARINLYQAWTALRSFTYFFYSPESRRVSYGLLEDAWLYLTLARDGSRSLVIQ